jgi:hypothetical protein
MRRCPAKTDAIKPKAYSPKSEARAKMKVHPEMLMKTKDGEKKVSGVRYQVSAKKSEVYGVESERPALATLILASDS